MTNWELEALAWKLLSQLDSKDREIAKLKRRIVGLEQTVSNFREKEEKRFGNCKTQRTK